VRYTVSIASDRAAASNEGKWYKPLPGAVLGGPAATWYRAGKEEWEEIVPAAKPGERRGGSVKTLLAFVALATSIAAPAFAKPIRTGHAQVRASNQEKSPIVHPYAADHHYPRPQYDYNNNANPDFQLGGSDR
jgi:hypothetical protein